MGKTVKSILIIVFRMGVLAGALLMYMFSIPGLHR